MPGHNHYHRRSTTNPVYRLDWTWRSAWSWPSCHRRHRATPCCTRRHYQTHQHRWRQHRRPLAARARSLVRAPCRDGGGGGGDGVSSRPSWDSSRPSWDSSRPSWDSSIPMHQAAVWWHYHPLGHRTKPARITHRQMGLLRLRGPPTQHQPCTPAWPWCSQSHPLRMTHQTPCGWASWCA